MFTAKRNLCFCLCMCYGNAMFKMHSGKLDKNLTNCKGVVECSGSGVELRTLDYENPGSNPGCSVKTLSKFFHSTWLQFTQLNK